MSPPPIRTVAVVGDGIAGRTAAIAFACRLPAVSVAIVPLPGPLPSVDPWLATTPASLPFHAEMGIELAGVRHAPHPGTRYDLGGPGAFVHAYGEVGRPVAGVAFAALWPWAGATPFEAYGNAARAALAGEAEGEACGLFLETAGYARALDRRVQALGIRRTAAPLAGVEGGGDRVTGLALADGGRLRADLFVDAGGTAAPLIGVVAGAAWSGWRAALPVDRRTPQSAAWPTGLETVRAGPAGLAVDGGATLWSSAQDASPGLPIAPGRRPRAWIGNVAAVGDAAAVLLPIGGLPMHLLHTQLDRLTASLCDTGFADVELDLYNREAGGEADRLRDFQSLPFCLSPRADSFWQMTRAVPPSAELAATIALFRARGHLPVHDSEGFPADSWRTMLFGLGLRPRRPEVLALAVDPDVARTALAAQLDALDRRYGPYRP